MNSFLLTGTAITFTTALCTAPVPAAGGDSNGLLVPPGAELRGRTTSGQRIDGRFVSLRDGVLTIRTEEGKFLASTLYDDDATMNLSDVDHLEYLVGRHDAVMPLWIIGLFVGGAIGGKASEGSYVPIMTVVGLVSGAIAGMVLGAAVTREEWAPVPLPPGAGASQAPDAAGVHSRRRE